MRLSIVIPAYNEEDRIVKTLESTLSYLGRQAYQSEILVVSDGSTDRTGAVVKTFQSGHAIAVRFLEYHPNQGKGYAVRYGMLRGAGEVVMFMDADYSVPMAEVEKGLRLIEDGYDIAIASRAVSGSVVTDHQNFFRELSGKFYTLIQSLYLGIRYRDTQCGFKLFKRGVAKDLFQQQKLNSVIFDPEILWLAKQQGCRVAEFPVNWRHVGDSRIQYDNIGKSLFVFQELFRIRKVH